MTRHQRRRRGHRDDGARPGPDLQAIGTRARREGDHYLVSGQKTFVTNIQNAGLILIVGRTGGMRRGA